MTGRTLEESYEGFTALMLSAIDEYYRTDQSKAARRKRRG